MPTAAPLAPTTNRLLHRLPARDHARVIARCEPVELVLGDILADRGDPVRHVHFPTASYISLVTPMDGNDRLEVALAGNEGMHGVCVAVGVAVSPVHALVQGGGLAWRMDSAVFGRELARVPSLRDSVDRYVYVLMSQLSRTAGCTRFHRIEQRLARWLLMTADRAHSPSFHVTHEFLASMLGVRRVGITEAASALQARRLIGYTRGAMTVRDRRGLERASCSCYRSDVDTYEGVFR